MDTLDSGEPRGMSKTVAILQSNYIPWKGYFDLIHDVDEVILYDDVQFTKHDWRNRNRIKTPNGLLWLTIPCGGDLKRLIHDVIIEDDSWQRRHWKSLVQFYQTAPYFSLYRERLEEIYLGKRWSHLSTVNHQLIRWIAIEVLGARVKFVDSREYSASGAKQARVMDLLQRARATKYISGPAAKAYLDGSWFDRCGIELQWKSYEGYPEYNQFFPPFVHELSILDVLFQTGPKATEYIWGWRDSAMPDVEGAN